MKIINILLLLCLALWTGCQTNDEPCQPPPCPRPNINSLIALKLYFPGAEVGDHVELVRLNKDDNAPIDTTSYALTADKEIIIGDGGPIGFTEPVSGDAIERATLNFQIRLSNNQEHSLSDIEIEKLLTPDECGCAYYHISTLQVDGETVEVNAASYTLSL